MSKKDKTKDRIIMGLLANVTVSETARATGISESTIYRYLRDVEFRQEYEKKRIEMLKDNCHTLQANMNKAIYELVDIIGNDETSPQIRLNAIDMLLRHSYRLTEQCDILERLEKLEENTQ